MTFDPLVKTSKFLSFILRHNPGEIGLQLDPEGWALVDDLIRKARRGLSRELIEQVVASNDKKRFALSDDGLYIRAVQGHSIAVDLGLEPIEPPAFLYHGTAQRFLSSILNEGLLPQNRQFVHLSLNEENARKVGQRHGKPVVLTIRAVELHQSGQKFYQAENGVWLTDKVGPSHLILS